MGTLQTLTLGASVPASPLDGSATAEGTPDRYVRMAEIEIDLAQLEAYKAAVKEEIEASVRVEPGVLALYAVSTKENPTHVRILEIYADEAHTRRIWKRRISRNTRPRRRTWSSTST